MGCGGLYLSILDVSESFSAGPTGPEAVYIVDLIICMRARVVAMMFVLSGPNAAVWCGIESKYVVVIPRTVALRSASRGIEGKVKTSSDRALIARCAKSRPKGSDLEREGRFWFVGVYWRSVEVYLGRWSTGEGYRSQY